MRDTRHSPLKVTTNPGDAIQPQLTAITINISRIFQCENEMNEWGSQKKAVKLEKIAAEKCIGDCTELTKDEWREAGL